MGIGQHGDELRRGSRRDRLYLCLERRGLDEQVAELRRVGIGAAEKGGDLLSVLLDLFREGLNGCRPRRLDLRQRVHLVIAQLEDCRDDLNRRVGLRRFSAARSAGGVSCGEDRHGAPAAEQQGEG